MGLMRRPLLGLVAVVLALSSSDLASAQETSPTATATPTPAASATPSPTPDAARKPKAKELRSVQADFRRDGKLDVCRHTPETLAEMLKRTKAEPNRFPVDFQPTLEATIEAQVRPKAKAKCEREAAKRAAEKKEDAKSPSDESGPSVAPQTPAPPAAPPAPAPAPAPPAPVPAPVAPVAPAPPLAPTLPSVPTPVPTKEIVPKAPEPGAPEPTATAASAEPQSEAGRLALTRTAATVNNGAPLPVVVFAAVLAVCLLASLSLFGFGRMGWGEQRLAGVRHALGEAGYRVGSTWQSFADWLRFGR